MTDTTWIAGGQIQMSTPDSYQQWLRHEIDEHDTTPLADYGFDAVKAVGRTVEQVLSQCGKGCLTMEISHEGWVVVHWDGPSSESGLDQLLAAVVAARRHRFRGWLHAVSNDKTRTMSICVQDGRFELGPLKRDWAMSPESLQKLDPRSHADPPQEVRSARANIRFERAPEGTAIPEIARPAIIVDPTDPRLSGVPARVSECVSAGGGAMPLEGQPGGFRWLLLEKWGSKRTPILLGDGGESPIDIDRLPSEPDVIQMGADLVLGGLFEVVRFNLETQQRYTLLEARAGPAGMKLERTAAGLAVGTGEGVLFVDPYTAQLRHRFNHHDMHVGNLFTVDDGAILFATHGGRQDGEMLSCSPQSVTHLGTLDHEIVLVWRDDELFVRSYTQTSIVGAPEPRSEVHVAKVETPRSPVRGQLVFADEAALAAWQQVRIDPSDYDFLELFPLREFVDEFIVGELLSGLADLAVDVDGPRITISGNLPDTFYLSGHLEAHQLCATFWAAAERGGRGDLFLFDITDGADQHWPCAWIQVDEEPRDVYFDEEMGYQLMERGPDITRELIAEVAHELGRDSR